jgi:peptide/nickel transport system permease protein
MTSIKLNRSFRVLSSLFAGDTFIYVFKRLLQALLTLFLASILCFAIIELAPGSYLDTLSQNPKISPETLKQLEQQFGLDKPAFVQYWLWLQQIVTRGNFGTSFVYQRSVASLLWERVPATLLMAIASLIVTWAIAIPLGIIAAVNQNRTVDRVLQVVSYTGQGFPSFIMALLLLFFAQNTSPLFPVGGMTSIDHADLPVWGQIMDYCWHLILPTVALSLTGFAGLLKIDAGTIVGCTASRLYQDSTGERFARKSRNLFSCSTECG